MILIRIFICFLVAAPCKGKGKGGRVGGGYTYTGSNTQDGVSGYSPVNRESYNYNIYKERNQQSSVNLNRNRNRKGQRNPGKRKSLKSKIADYGKPPLLAYNKPKKFTNFEKLQLVIDVDNNDRYSYNEYIELLSKDEVVAKDDESFTTVRMVGLTTVNTKGPTQDFEVTWQISKTYTTDEKKTYFRFHVHTSHLNRTHHGHENNRNNSSEKNDNNTHNDRTHYQSGITNDTSSGKIDSITNIFPKEDTNNLSKRKIKVQHNVTFKMNSRSLKTCMQELHISTSNEPILAYTCYYWSGGPQIFLLSFVTLLCLFFICLPVLIAMLYVSSVSGRQNHCYMVPNHGEHQNVSESKQKSAKTFLLCLIFGSICLCFFAALIYVFLETNHALNMNNSTNVLTTNLAIRISISLASLLAALFLSQLASGIRLRQFIPLTRCMCSALNDKDDEVVSCILFDFICLIGFIICIAAAIIEIAFTISIILYKGFHIFLLGGSFFLAEGLQNLYIWTRRIKFETKELLYYGYLSEQEKSQWLSAVEPYVSIIQASLKSSNFYSYFNLHNRRIKDRTPKVSYLHTGSIPEQFGKPLMVFDGLNRSVSNSFPELRSDHDVMFVMEHIPVYENGNENDQDDVWLKAEVMEEDGHEEFVKIVPMLSNNILIPFLSNKISSNFLTDVISNSFFQNGKTTDKLKELPMMINTREMGQSMSSSNQVFISRAGPSVNMKVTGKGGHLVFDCDFLLSLPVIGWPSPAKEWRIRGRKWPEKEMVEWLLLLPCHLIAKPIIKHDQKTWRFSFSRQELELSKILPHNARLCYIALKHIFKKHLKSFNCGLKSYHMLTLFFWFMEMVDPAMWQQVDKGPFSFSTTMSSLLKFVAESLQAKYIPHYFIRTINLVKIMRADTHMTARPLRDVAAHIQKIYARDDLTHAYIFDQTAHDTIILNRELHKNVVREKNPPACFTPMDDPYYSPQIPDPDYDCFTPIQTMVLTKPDPKIEFFTATHDRDKGPQIPVPDYDYSIFYSSSGTSIVTITGQTDRQDCFTPLPAKITNKPDPDYDFSILKTNYHHIMSPDHSPQNLKTKFGPLMCGSEIGQVNNSKYGHELADYEGDYVPPTLLFYGPVNAED